MVTESTSQGRKLKIAHVVAVFPPYWSGTGTVAYFNARELAHRGHEVHVFTSAVNGAPALEKRDGITIHRLRPILQFGNAPLLPGLLRIKGFDILHLHHPFIFGSELVWLVSKMRGIPFVMTHHNDLIGEGLRRFLFRSYSLLSNRLVFEGASKFAVVSLDHASRCGLSAEFQKRWSDVIEVPNGVDTQMFNPHVYGGQIRKELGLSAESKMILFVGALDRAHYFKGLDYLLKAFSLVRSSHEVLVVVGDGELKSQFMRKALSLGIGEHVRFAGAIPHNQTPQYYAAADLVVLPSRPPESFGVVLLEAMATGKPVIASDIPGVRTVVTVGENGLLVEYGNVRDLAHGLRTLLDDPTEDRLMGRAGLHKVRERYNWERVVDRLEIIYQEVAVHTESCVEYAIRNT